MWRGTVSYIWTLGLLLGACAYQTISPPKYEGQVCKTMRGAQWTCQRASKCPDLNKLLSKKLLLLCTSRDTESVVCCPQCTPQHHASISEKKCKEYQRLTCSANPRVASSNPENNSTIEDFMEDKPLDDWVNPDVGIYGGVPAKPGEFPHAAVIGYGDEGSIIWRCGGTLLSKKFILSAAHCSNSTSGLARWALLGDINYASNTEDAGAQKFQIVERLLHMGYQEPRLYNDIVLFRLDRDVVLTRYVAPACLHTNPCHLAGLGTAIGWGLTGPNTGMNKELMKVDLNFVPPERCNRVVGSLDVDLKLRLPNGVDRSMLCGYMKDKNICQGDSGSGIVLANKGQDCLHRLVGVVSFSAERCISHRLPSGFTRVSSFIEWIESNVWPTPYD